MRVSMPFLRAFGAIAAIAVVAACNLEVNINLNSDDSVPKVEPPTADAPVVTMPPPARGVPEALPPHAPRQLTPPSPVEPADAIRDALLRREAPEQLRQREGIGPTAGPSFTPFTAAPTILNRQQIISVLRESYPPLLRNAGIGGTVKVFILIESDGTVEDVRIDQSSGHSALDDAALAVARVYRFAPARNHDEAVPVWVSFPITFQPR